MQHGKAHFHILKNGNGIVLYPSRMRIDLLVLLLGHTNNGATVIEDDHARTTSNGMRVELPSCALVDGSAVHELKTDCVFLRIPPIPRIRVLDSRILSFSFLPFCIPRCPQCNRKETATAVVFARYWTFAVPIWEYFSRQFRYNIVQRNRDSPRREFHSEELFSLFRFDDSVGSFQSSVFLQSLMDCPIEKNNVGRLFSSNSISLVATGISAFSPTTCLSSMTTCMIVFADMALARRLSRTRASLVRQMLHSDD